MSANVFSIAQLPVLHRSVQPISILPFTKDDLFESGRPENWRRLEKILSPIIREDFAVTSVDSQLMLDRTVKLFNETKNLHGENTLIKMISKLDSPDDAYRVQILLSVGVDPDIPDYNPSHPSHWCAFMGLLGAAEAVFSCRPSMKARDEYNNTPLMAAQAEYPVSTKLA